LRSFIDHFDGNHEFPRLLIGIDRPAPKGEGDIHGWVLGKFTDREMKILFETEKNGMKSAEKLLRDWINPPPVQAKNNVQKPAKLPRDPIKKAEKGSKLPNREIGLVTTDPNQLDSEVKQVAT
jgi:Peptidyl-tRNA hydrolase